MNPAPDNVPDPAIPPNPCSQPGAPCADYASEVYKLVTQAEKCASETMSGLLKLQGELKEAEKTLHEVIRGKSNTVAALTGIKHLTKNRFPYSTGGSTTNVGGSGSRIPVPPKALCILVLTVIVALLQGNIVNAPAKPTPYRHTSSTSENGGALPQQFPQQSVDLACVYLRNGDHANAATEFRKAFNEGGDAELCLGRLAECQYRLNQDSTALQTCDELTHKVPSSGWAPFIRGLVFKRQGKTEEARYQFNVAAVRGHRAAKLQLSTPTTN